MNSTRDTLLTRIKQAVAAGNVPGATPPLPARGNVGYQGAGSDMVKRFCDELTAVGGQAHIVLGLEAAAVKVSELVHEILRRPLPQPRSHGRHLLLGRGPVLDKLLLSHRLGEQGIEVQSVDSLPPGAEKEAFFKADIGISGVAYAIAETGTLVMASGPNDPRSLSLTPMIHIAVVSSEQLLPDLFDLFTELEPQKDRLPACLSFITGPSKTGDIELKLVTGVHGPGEVHVVVIA